MTDQHHGSLLDEHSNAFGADLHRVSAALAQRRRRTRRAVSIMVPLAGAATLTVAFWPGGSHLDVLERATAALEPSTGVIHFRVNTTPIGMSQPPCAEEPTDVWLETAHSSAPRWRYRANSARCMTRGVEYGLGHILTGRDEVWFDGQSRSVHAIDDGWVETLVDIPAANTDRQLPDVTQLAGGPSEDPLETLRQLYTSGKVRPTGLGAIAGQRVRFFEGPYTLTDASGTVRIAVDATSFAPVEVRVRLNQAPEVRQGADDAALGFRVRFTAYDAATEHDLAPSIPAGTVRARMDYQAFRLMVRRAGAYPPAPISASERARAKARLGRNHESRRR